MNECLPGSGKSKQEAQGTEICEHMKRKAGSKKRKLDLSHLHDLQQETQSLRWSAVPFQSAVAL